jgi:hypothetical protein
MMFQKDDTPEKKLKPLEPLISQEEEDRKQ